MRLQLKSTTREKLEKSETKRIRRDGGIPATVYGRGDDPHSIAVEDADIRDILKTPGGRLSLIDLKVDGKGSKAHPVMIQDIQRDPITQKILHIDFHRVSMDEPVNASVPIVVVGEAPGIKEGGILDQATREIQVRALPDQIPTHINVDVSELRLGQHLTVGDLEISENVEVTGPPADIAVVSVRQPVVHIEPTVEEEVEEGEEAQVAEEQEAAEETEES